MLLQLVAICSIFEFQSGHTLLALLGDLLCPSRLGAPFGLGSLRRFGRFGRSSLALLFSHARGLGLAGGLLGRGCFFGKSGFFNPGGFCQASSFSVGCCLGSDCGCGFSHSSFLSLALSLDQPCLFRLSCQALFLGFSCHLGLALFLGEARFLHLTCFLRQPCLLGSGRFLGNSGLFSPGGLLSQTGLLSSGGFLGQPFFFGESRLFRKPSSFRSLSRQTLFFRQSSFLCQTNRCRLFLFQPFPLSLRQGLLFERFLAQRVRRPGLLFEARFLLGSPGTFLGSKARLFLELPGTCLLGALFCQQALAFGISLATGGLDARRFFLHPRLRLANALLFLQTRLAQPVQLGFAVGHLLRRKFVLLFAEGCNLRLFGLGSRLLLGALLLDVVRLLLQRLDTGSLFFRCLPLLLGQRLRFLETGLGRRAGLFQRCQRLFERRLLLGLSGTLGRFERLESLDLGLDIVLVDGHRLNRRRIVDGKSTRIVSLVQTEQ